MIYESFAEQENAEIVKDHFKAAQVLYPPLCISNNKTFVRFEKLTSGEIKSLIFKTF